MDERKVVVVFEDFKKRVEVVPSSGVHLHTTEQRSVFGPNEVYPLQNEEAHRH